MSERIVYVNGTYVPENEASISVFDRGFLFSDGVYEVCSVLDGRLVDNAAHMARLARSLSALSISCPLTDDEICSVQKSLIEQNNLKEGVVYLQVTRGPADRDFACPQNSSPTIVLFTQEKKILDHPKAAIGLNIVSVPDLRWARRDIKSVGLLAPVLAKQEAIEKGADDAWMVENDTVTEGTSHNAYIVTRDERIVTRHLSSSILPGITRRVVLDLAQNLGLTIEERPFTVEEAINAAEAFATSASMFVLPIVSINEMSVGDGTPGPITRDLRARYIDLALTEAV